MSPTSDSTPCTPAAAAARKVNTGSLISLSNGSAPAVLAQLLKKSKTFSNFFADCIYMGAVHKGSKGTKSIARYSADVASLNARWISNNRPPSAPTVGKTHKTITTCPGLYKACEACSHPQIRLGAVVGEHVQRIHELVCLTH